MGLVKFVFDNYEINCRVVISKDQLKRILNIDGSCLALDGRKIQKGGRPAVIFYHRKLPQLRKAKIKTSTAITMIGGSIAAEEPVPPHFQFPTKAKSEETMIMRTETVAYFHKVLRT